MKLFTKSMEPNTTLGVAERVAYMSGNIGIKINYICLFDYLFISS